MERLTKMNNGVLVYIGPECDNPETGDIPAELNTGAVRYALSRLAAYEDSGLEPEDLRNIGSCETIPITRERLFDILHAEEDGRLVVLPCKVGDTVYRVFSVKDMEPVVVPCEIKTVGQAADLVGRIGKKGWLVNTYLSRQEAEEALREEEPDNVDCE